MNINGENLRQIRDSKGWSQKEFAKFLGISERSYQNYEGGGAIPDAKKALIRSKLDANIAYKKTPLKEAGSMEDLLSNAVIEKLKPLLAGVQENHSTMIEGISEMQRQLALVLLDNDELQDHVEDLKEELEFIKRELKRVVR